MQKTLEVGRSPFEDLFAREYPGVVGAAWRVLRDRAEAEEVAQEVFLQLHLSAVTVENPGAWLRTGAVHQALNRIRSRERRSIRERLAWRRSAQESDDPALLVQRAHEARVVRAALARLPRRSATALVLRHSGLSYAEVAKATGINVNQVGTVLRRAESALRREVINATSE